MTKMVELILLHFHLDLWTADLARRAQDRLSPSHHAARVLAFQCLVLRGRDATLSTRIITVSELIMVNHFALTDAASHGCQFCTEVQSARSRIDIVLNLKRC